MSSQVKRPFDNIVHTVDSGPVVIDILRGTTNDGHTYLYFQLARAWKPSTASQLNFSPRFYERNEKELNQAIQKACTWIRKNPSAADADYQSPKLHKAA